MRNWKSDRKEEQEAEDNGRVPPEMLLRWFVPLAVSLIPEDKILPFLSQ